MTYFKTVCLKKNDTETVNALTNNSQMNLKCPRGSKSIWVSLPLAAIKPHDEFVSLDMSAVSHFFCLFIKSRDCSVTVPPNMAFPVNCAPALVFTYLFGAWTVRNVHYPDPPPIHTWLASLSRAVESKRVWHGELSHRAQLLQRNLSALESTSLHLTLGS